MVINRHTMISLIDVLQGSRSCATHGAKVNWYVPCPAAATEGRWTWTSQPESLGSDDLLPMAKLLDLSHT